MCLILLAFRVHPLYELILHSTGMNIMSGARRPEPLSGMNRLSFLQQGSELRGELNSLGFDIIFWETL